MLTKISHYFPRITVDSKVCYDIINAEYDLKTLIAKLFLGEVKAQAVSLTSEHSPSSGEEIASLTQTESPVLNVKGLPEVSKPPKGQ